MCYYAIINVLCGLSVITEHCHHIKKLLEYCSIKNCLVIFFSKSSKHYNGNEKTGKEILETFTLSFSRRKSDKKVAKKIIIYSKVSISYRGRDT